ncbi:MAG: hypothetical protein WBL61_24370 [Bryobacteraceae bacterium]
MLAVAALLAATPVVALADNNRNSGTGKTGPFGTGDINFNGTAVAPMAAAGSHDVSRGGATTFNPIDDSKLNLLASTDIASKRIQVEGAAPAAPTGPTVTMVQNNYSFVLPDAPNYGIAPGSLILIKGNSLVTPGSSASPLQDPSKALPTTLNGAQVTIAVGGTSVNPAFYYACDGQVCDASDPNHSDLLAVVIPSSTPAGAGTLTVTSGGVTSAPMSIQIAPAVFGFGAYGGGLAVATDNNDWHLITSTNSAKPGEYVVFWGSGDGADTANDDVNPPKHYGNLNGISALYFGNVSVPIIYQGRSGYQGVDQVVVQIPANTPTGCAVSVSAVSGTGSGALASNIVSLPIAANGGTCVDPVANVDPSLAATLSTKSSVKYGFAYYYQQTWYYAGNASYLNAAQAAFYSISGALLIGQQSQAQPSLGSCFVSQTSSAVQSANPLTALNAGTISLQGSIGTINLPPDPANPGSYFANPATEIFPTSAGATMTFTGTAGTDVGAFSIAVPYPNALAWTNASTSSSANITRSAGVTVNWTGGAPGNYAQISGNSSSGTFTGSFVCNATATDQQFTVPPAVLLALPVSTEGKLIVSTYTNPVSTSVPGLDFFYGMSSLASLTFVNYN